MSDPLTPARVAELRRLAEAATPGPWLAKCQAYHHPHSGRCGVHWWITGGAGVALAMDEGTSKHAKANANLIAAANPATVLALCAAADLLREVAEIAEAYRSIISEQSTHTSIWKRVDPRWLAIRDKVMGKEADRDE